VLNTRYYLLLIFNMFANEKMQLSSFLAKLNFLRNFFY